MTVSILFSTSNALISRIIRWFSKKLGRDKGRASHACVALNLGCLCIVAEATFPGGVRVLTRKKWDQEHNKLAEYRANLVELAMPLDDALDLLGEDYDIPALFGYIPVMIWRWFGRKIRNPFASARKQVCSEFAYRLLTRLLGEVPEWKGFDCETVLPDDLWERIEKGGPTFVKVV
jgi:hypothetical protein